MDILDIDEALKDDSFICREDKIHDEVSNILQQWKSSNCLPTQQNQNQNQHHEEHVYKLNSKTFTRPKRKCALNLESQDWNTNLTNGALNNQQQSQKHQPHQQQQKQQQNSHLMLNMEIGGLVTTMNRSPLQDTSPPTSIRSSLDMSIDRMSNSLITSADFLNVSFLDSPLDYNDANNRCELNFNFNDKTACDGYTLSDMIRDRKALESLTLSGDGTFIKDSQIAQIDDISLALSKTASGCSTMYNSTDSVESNNQTLINNTFKALTLDKTVTREDSDTSALYRTMIISDELIGDTTCSLIQNSMHVEPTDSSNDPLHSSINTTHVVTNKHQDDNMTFNILSDQSLNNTYNVTSKNTAEKANTTYDCQEKQLKEACESPDVVANNTSRHFFYESTPQTRSTNRQTHNAHAKISAYNVNLSPITSIAAEDEFHSTRNLSKCFDAQLSKKSKSKINSATFDGLPSCETMELLDNIENPNENFSMNFQPLKGSSVGLEMQNVMNLAQAEADLLAGNDDDEAQFEQMLDEYSKIELNSEQLKMKKSLEIIKKRFNYGAHLDKSDLEESRESRSIQDSVPLAAKSIENQNSAGKRLNSTMELRNDNLHNLKDTMRNRSMQEIKDSKFSPSRDSMISYSNDLRNLMSLSKESASKELRDSSTNGSTSSSASGMSNTGERLLSRRSRLYDEINLSTLSTAPKVSLEELENKTDDLPKADAEKLKSAQDRDNGSYKLTQKRERDPDRFKTIDIVNENDKNDNHNSTRTELIVPCIDDQICEFDENDVQQTGFSEQITQPTQRYSRRDYTLTVFNSNRTEAENTGKFTKNVNTKYLTYKKPKDKQLKCNLPEVAPIATTQAMVLEHTLSPRSRLEPRSLSRPRYISGLQKTVYKKATSASNLQETIAAKCNNSTVALATNAKHSQINTGTKQMEGELKSPMGIKSKSFSNLTHNFGYAPVASADAAKYVQRADAAANKQPKNEDALFKVPKLVSGIRAPGANNQKRAGFVRPSSGYYSLNVGAKGSSHAQEADSDADRHSPAESMSSASSRGSCQNTSTRPSCNENSTGDVFVPTNLTEITMGSTGIPRPSGIRPPSNIKRSGIPRPSSIVRR